MLVTVSKSVRGMYVSKFKKSVHGWTQPQTQAQRQFDTHPIRIGFSATLIHVENYVQIDWHKNLLGIKFFDSRPILAFLWVGGLTKMSSNLVFGKWPTRILIFPQKSGRINWAYPVMPVESSKSLFRGPKYPPKVLAFLLIAPPIFNQFSSVIPFWKAQGLTIMRK